MRRQKKLRPSPLLENDKNTVDQPKVDKIAGKNIVLNKGRNS